MRISSGTEEKEIHKELSCEKVFLIKATVLFLNWWFSS